ncbi:Hypothetical predicted protein, partial [Marmota monax]
MQFVVGDKLTSQPKTHQPTRSIWSLQEGSRKALAKVSHGSGSVQDDSFDCQDSDDKEKKAPCELEQTEKPANQKEPTTAHTVKLPGALFSVTENNVLEFLVPLKPVAIRIVGNVHGNNTGDQGHCGRALALWETQLVQEVRRFLIDNGVSLDSFSQAAEKRSKTVILAKNLPAGTLAAELQETFGRFGSLGCVLLCEGGVTAIVEFLEPLEARKAFRHLAYSKVGRWELLQGEGPGAGVPTAHTGSAWLHLGAGPAPPHSLRTLQKAPSAPAQLRLSSAFLSCLDLGLPGWLWRRLCL